MKPRDYLILSMLLFAGITYPVKTGVKSTDSIVLVDPPLNMQ